MSDDDVARHKRPPRKGQFHPGQSGNPRGRPKGSKNIRTYVHELLGAKIPVIEGGKTRNIPRAQAIAIQLVNLAAKGDPKGLAAILNLTRELDEAIGQSRPGALMQIADEEVMQDIIARIRAEHPLPSADAESDLFAHESVHGLEPQDSTSQGERA
jgi:Family of unknown function (DUF5681)